MIRTKLQPTRGGFRGSPELALVVIVEVDGDTVRLAGRFKREKALRLCAALERHKAPDDD